MNYELRIGIAICLQTHLFIKFVAVEVIKKYSNGEISIVWKPKLCIHSEHCFKGLPAVFNPKEKPWIKPENASSDELIEQVGQCTSSALSWERVE